MNRVLAVAALTLFAIGCKPGALPDGGVAHYYVCQVDEAKLLAGGDCLWDDACPCGSHCAAGSCKFDCRVDGDCSNGQVCDGFGRCITAPPVLAAGADASTPVSVAQPIDVSPHGTLKLTGVPLQLDDAHTLGQFTVTAQGVDVPELKLSVSEAGGIEVQCEPGGPFATGCVMKALVVGAPRSITVRVTDPTRDGAFEASLFTTNEALGFRVHFTKQTVITQAPLEGVYRGFARPQAFGSIARTASSPLPTPLAELTVPIDVVVYPQTAGTNARPVTLHDPLGVIFPDDVTIGQLLQASNGDLQLRHGARAFLGAGTDGGTKDIDVAASATSVSVEQGKQGLTIVLKTRFSGVLDPANDPYVTWVLALGRVGALDAGVAAPLAPADYVGRDPVAQASVPNPAETYMNSTVTGLGSALAAAPGDGGTPTAAQLAQAVMCTPLGTSPRPSLTLAGTISSPYSGDFDCTTANNGTAPQLTVQVLKESTFQLADELGKCLGDFKNTQAIIDNALTLTPPAVAPCVDGARVITALAYAQNLDRARALGTNVSADPLASALAHRLVQQWLRTNLFVARQATQVDVLNDILASEVQLSSPLNQFDMLALTGRGYNLVLEPRVAMGLNRMLPQVLLAPDYRPLVSPSTMLPLNPRHEQPTALPVAMVDVLAQTIKVYDALYERARYVQTDRVPLETSAREFLRKSLVLFAMAANMSDTAQANSATAPRWLTQWNRQAGLYGIGFAGLLRSIDNLRRGENPLGIDDKLDLPLYRVGDQTGTISQFSAVSDYLLGTGGSLDNAAIVPQAIATAETSLTDARAAYTMNLQQTFTQAGLDADATRRITALNRDYGSQISSLCGDPNMDSNTVLATADGIDPDTCYIKAACRLTPVQQRALMAPGEVARLLCTAASIREQLGPSALRGPDGAVLTNAFNPTQLDPLLRGSVTVRGMTEGATSLLVTMSDGSQVSVVPALFVANSNLAPPGALTVADQQQLQARCDAVASATENVRPDLSPASCTLNGDCPGSFACAAGNCKPVADTAHQTSCYQGSLGEMTVSIRGAVQDVAIARSQLAELTSTYDLQVKKCNQQQAGDNAVIVSDMNHNATVEKLAAVKLAADVVASVADATASCADSVGSDTKLGVASGIACGADAVKAAATSVSAGMDFAMGQADRAHDVEVAQIQAGTAYATCLTEAEMSLVGTHTAVLQIERAMQEVASQLVAFENAKNDLRGAISEGHEAIAAENDLTVPGISVEYWLSEKVETYNAAFRAARRVAYLGVLAVEYEYQLSTVERGNVLAATRTSDLRGVLDRLRNIAAAGNVHGSNPSNLHDVVSLRANLMQLADQSAVPAGWHSLTDVQRFQLFLTSPRFAVYDATGKYLGQDIPFRVAPLAALKLGQTGGVTLLSGQDCAERVWSVNAALEGDGVIVGDATRTRITLKKRNRFFSQWCTPAPTTDPYQLDATRPSRNLFLDPFQDYTPTGPGAMQNPAATIDAQAEADAFTAARLQPAVNVTRADFEGDQYFNGSSRELAGRGLYGDYTLFFPVEMLSTGASDGLRIDHLSDVLLRFDFVSVAQH
jgi:hypothetical protein